MRNKPTTPHTALETTAETRRRPPAEITRRGEYPVFVAPLVDGHGTVWLELPASWPLCSCGIPVAANHLTCGSRLCPGVR